MANPHIIDCAGSLLERYDVLLCDIWGVVHDGQRVHPDANAALKRFRERGGSVILVSNSPSPSPGVARILDDKGIERTAWDRIVSSGDLALRRIASEGYTRIFGIGPVRRDRLFFEALPGTSDRIETADALACTGLVDDRRERPEDYLPALRSAQVRNLPFVCANPDLSVHVGADLLPCAGAIAALYEALGGSVHWAGKPHPIAYETALELAMELRAGQVERSRVLAIGDSIRTDLAAAAAAGIDALFITSGIHRDEVMADGSISGPSLAVALAGLVQRPIASAASLKW